MELYVAMSLLVVKYSLVVLQICRQFYIEGSIYHVLLQ